jgi:hypothetical protein
MSIILNRTPQEAVQEFSNQNNTQKVVAGYMPGTIPVPVAANGKSQPGKREFFARILPYKLLEEYQKSGSKESFIDFVHQIGTDSFYRYIVYHATDKGSVPCINHLRKLTGREKEFDGIYCKTCGDRFNILDLAPKDAQKREFLESKGKKFNKNNLPDGFFSNGLDHKMRKGIEPSKEYLYLLYVHQFPSDFIESNNSVDYLPKIGNGMLFVARVNEKTHKVIKSVIADHFDNEDNEQFLRSIDPTVDVAPYFRFTFKAEYKNPKDPKSKEISLVLALTNNTCEYNDELKGELVALKEGTIKPEETMLFGKSNLEHVIVEDKYDVVKQKAAHVFALQQMNNILIQKGRSELCFPIENPNEIVANMPSQEKPTCFGSFIGGDVDCIKCSYLTKCENVTGGTATVDAVTAIPRSQSELDGNMRALTHKVAESTYDDEVPF